MIRRRSSPKSDRDDGRNGNRPVPFFNLTEDPAPAEDVPLFNLEDHEKRILSWSPEPDELESRADAKVVRPVRRKKGAHRPPAIRPTVTTPPAAAAAPPAPPPAAPVVQPVASPARPLPALEPLRKVAPSAPVAPARVGPQAETEELAPAERAPKRRGRPRGRPRRQVHFHVDPDEERLLMAAVELYGSQQKGLVAALESLQEADLLRDEIERLRAEVERQRRLLDEAESLFAR